MIASKALQLEYAVDGPRAIYSGGGTLLASGTVAAVELQPAGRALYRMSSLAAYAPGFRDYPAISISGCVNAANDVALIPIEVNVAGNYVVLYNPAAVAEPASTGAFEIRVAGGSSQVNAYRMSRNFSAQSLQPGQRYRISGISLAPMGVSGLLSPTPPFPLYCGVCIFEAPRAPFAAGFFTGSGSGAATKRVLAGVIRQSFPATTNQPFEQIFLGNETSKFAHLLLSESARFIPGLSYGHGEDLRLAVEVTSGAAGGDPAFFYLPRMIESLGTLLAFLPLSQYPQTFGSVIEFVARHQYLVAALHHFDANYQTGLTVNAIASAGLLYNLDVI